MHLGTNPGHAGRTMRVVDVHSSDRIKPRWADEQPKPFQNIQWIGVLRALTA